MVDGAFGVGPQVNYENFTKIKRNQGETALSTQFEWIFQAQTLRML